MLLLEKSDDVGVCQELRKIANSKDQIEVIFSVICFDGMKLTVQILSRAPGSIEALKRQGISRHKQGNT